MNEQSLIDTINILYDSFYEQEKKIASYVLHHPEEVMKMSITQLANKNSTSVATVTRFCRKCSLEGFHHLKIALARETAASGRKTRASSTIDPSQIESSLHSFLDNKKEELEATISSIDPDLLKTVLDRIENASQVLFFAVGSTICCAMDGAYKFNEIGISSAAFSIWENGAGYLLNMKEGDVLIALSNSGESSEVVRMIEQARKQKITTLAITNNPESHAALAAEYHIRTSTREKLFQNEFYFSRISLMSVIEILYLFLTASGKDSWNHLSKAEELIAGTKI